MLTLDQNMLTIEKKTFKQSGASHKLVTLSVITLIVIPSRVSLFGQPPSCHCGICPTAATTKYRHAPTSFVVLGACCRWSHDLLKCANTRRTSSSPLSVSAVYYMRCWNTVSGPVSRTSSAVYVHVTPLRTLDVDTLVPGSFPSAGGRPYQSAHRAVER